jgi:hypothetical protein
LKKVIVDTFHSIHRIGTPEVLAFDSHADAWLGATQKVVEVIRQFSKINRAIWERHYVRIAQRGQGKVHLIMPWRALYGATMTEFRLVEDILREQGEKPGTIFDHVESYKRMMDAFNIHIQTVPPDNINAVLKNTPIGSTIDLDADYIQEYQQFCLTHAPGLLPDKRVKRMLSKDQWKRLGKIETFLEAVTRIKPEQIYVSEFNEEGIERAKAELFPLLEKQGYTIKYNYMIPDAKAKPLVAKYDTFWKTVIKEKIDALDEGMALGLDAASFEAKTNLYVEAVKMFPSFSF